MQKWGGIYPKIVEYISYEMDDTSDNVLDKLDGASERDDNERWGSELMGVVSRIDWKRKKKEKLPTFPYILFLGIHMQHKEKHNLDFDLEDWYICMYNLNVYNLLLNKR